MRQDRKSECSRVFDTSVESLRHRLDFSVVTNASNDLLDSDGPNLLYTWACRQPSALLLLPPPLLPRDGKERIKPKLQGWRACKHSCHSVTT